jgi:hypothetical protein
MKKLISEISRIKQMMGISESWEEDKKIADEFIEFVKNTSVDDMLDKDKEKYLQLRQKYDEVSPRTNVYEKIQKATSFDDLIYFFSDDEFSFKKTLENHFSIGDIELRLIRTALCVFNGGSEDECIKSSQKVILTDYPIEFDKIYETLNLIPGLKEKVLKFQRLKQANKIKSNIEKNKIKIDNTKQTNTVETPTISADQYVSKLNYSDVGYPDVDAGGSMRKYAEALSKEDKNKVEKTVKELVNTFRNIMQNVFNKKISMAASSESWAYWDIGKQLYMYTNPDESSGNYVLGNPLEDKTLFWDMIYRMIGWEMTNGGKKSDGSKYSSWELKNKGKELYNEKNSK